MLWFCRWRPRSPSKNPTATAGLSVLSTRPNPLSALLLPLIVVACGAPPPADAPPSPTAPTEPAPTGPASEPTSNAVPPDHEPAKRPSLTQQECEAQGGAVTGDIGDGATQRPDYVCASGKAPLGNVSAPKGGPIGVEGSVCCPK
jgi:hypothetical protein